MFLELTNQVSLIGKNKRPCVLKNKRIDQIIFHEPPGIFFHRSCKQANTFQS